MKKQVFHDAAADVLIGLILSILFSLIYAPNTYAPLNPYSLIGQVMDQHQVHGALVLLYCTLIWAAIVCSSTWATTYSAVTGACFVPL
ncbi:integral membrane protein [Streptococcus pneumoniae]|nr:integral membrane protein [Streptococcus pneumoniae]CKI78311.1 integral membrane protein [Streptococcus pneumoniae]SNJ52069.1 integral membrane protein [Streptococcus pneumoniae]SNJ52211.1 integral membrane protein [Streptococcus pneumoniae]SNJ69345.1 integral membrane protein [Streptococcus pneumoniae]